MKSPFEIITPDQSSNWNDYVMRHGKGTIFHTVEMQHVFADTKDYEPIAIAARDSSGTIRAMLTAVRISTLSGFAMRFSSRSVWYCEPICDHDEIGMSALQLLIQEHDRVVKAKTLFTEIRPVWSPSEERSVLEEQGYEYCGYLNFVCDLTTGADALFSGMSKSYRRAVPRAPERGIEIRVQNDSVAGDLLYEMTSVSYNRSKIPLADKSLFQAAQKYLPADWYRIAVARHNGRPVASLIDLYFKDLVFGWHGGSELISGVAANTCLTWNAVKAAADRGYRFFDFGGAGWPDEEYGPRSFKQKFGGTLVNYGRYRKVHSKVKLAVAERAYHFLRPLVAPARAK